MQGFWNDANGLTVVDLLAFVLGLGTLAVYWKFGGVDDNYADIVIATVLGAAGQHVGTNWVRRRVRQRGGDLNENSN